MTSTDSDPRNSGNVLAEKRYLRERSDPSFADLNYLILTDIRELVRKTAPRMTGVLLDYGCGGAPYRTLFTNCSAYVGADMIPGPNIDLVLTSDGLTNEPAETYEAVFSAQVLEHVRDPAGYVDECARILKKRGLLLLSTHGLFLEHKCPNDYYRWTPQGLEELLRTHGFELIESFKLTAGTRGAIQMLHYLVDQFRYQPPSFTTLLLRALRKLYNWVCVPGLNLCGKWLFKDVCIVPANNTATIYIGVSVLARKL